MVEIRDRLQPLFGTERHALEQNLVVGNRLRVEDADRIAVGRRFSAGARADILHAAGTILDHDRLVPALDQFVSERAHGNIADPAGTGGGQRPDRTRGVILRERRACEHNEREDEQGFQHRSHLQIASELKDTLLRSAPRKRGPRPWPWIPAGAGMSGVCCLLRSSPRKRGPRGHWRRLWVPGLASLARDTKRWIPAGAGMSGVCCLLRSSPRKRGPRGHWRRLWVPGLASLARDTKTWIPAGAGMNGQRRSHI